MAQPHNKVGPPPSLWWYRLPRPDRNRVIDAYIDRYKKGYTVPPDFKDDIRQWLDDLSQLQNMAAWGHPKTHRYWAAPSYALAHGMEKATLMKRLREMEEVAGELYPDFRPPNRRPRAPLTLEEIQTIRKRYLEGENCKDLAQEFRLTPSHVGLLCRKEKAIRDENRIRLQDEHHQPQPANSAQPTSDGFDDDLPL